MLCPSMPKCRNKGGERNEAFRPCPSYHPLPLSPLFPPLLSLTSPFFPPPPLSTMPPPSNPEPTPPPSFPWKTRKMAEERGGKVLSFYPPFFFCRRPHRFNGWKKKKVPKKFFSFFYVFLQRKKLRMCALGFTRKKNLAATAIMTKPRIKKLFTDMKLVGKLITFPPVYSIHCTYQKQGESFPLGEKGGDFWRGHQFGH